MATTRAGDQRGSDPDGERLAVITGASSGIGHCIATLLGTAGYRTVLVARRRQRLERLAETLRVHARSTVHTVDLSDRDATGEAFKAISEEHGAPSVLVNCAGAGIYAPFMAHSDDDVERMFQLNCAAPIQATRILLPSMIWRAASGLPAHIVNICSMSARMGPWGHLAYATSKGGMRAFTESLACELHGTGVGCTIVYPGIIRTEYFHHPRTSALWPVVASRAIEADQVARVALRNVESSTWNVRYVPWHYRFIDILAALSPRIALRLTRGGSIPRTSQPQERPRHASPR